MKNKNLFSGILVFLTPFFMAQEQNKDSLKNEKIKQVDEVFVRSLRARNVTPTTFFNLDKKELDRQNFGQDLPYFLENSVGTVVSSDAGAGIGYTGVRIRGVDPTRTNVTINGIPINDAESHGVWWVNMPDFASSVDNIQVQRGVGTSTNGAAAFGASINISTDKLSRKPFALLDNSFGSFNTMKNTIKVGTGLMDNNFSFDLRLSNIQSDGFIDRASSNLRSYYFSGAYVGKKSSIKANVFSGKEITYQAWYGIPESKLRGTNEELTSHFYNNYYPGGMYQDPQDSTNLYSSNSRTYNIYQYDNEVDNYQQNHYQLLYDYRFSSKLKLNLAGHYTKGFGFYEQYRKNEDLSAYGLNPVILTADTITQSDLIRRRWLNNDFYGGIYSLEFTPSNTLDIILGGGYNRYTGRHFGEIIWAEFASNSSIRDTYYDNDAEKSDFNTYLKVYKKLAKFNLFADLQLRSISYSFLGIDQVNNSLQEAQEAVNFTFFNPKAGVTYELNSNSLLYGSFAMSNREPVRDDFRENLAGNRPKHETLQDIEMGYRIEKNRFKINANLYYMNYINQLVLTGKINDVGGYTRTNVDKSFRRGFEMEAQYQLIPNSLLLGMNLALSQNKIPSFTEFVDNYDNYDAEGNMIQDQIQHTNTDIAFSPNFIGNIFTRYSIKKFSVQLMSKYVGTQFLDNTSNSTKMLDAYFISNLSASYNFSFAKGQQINISALVNNLFNHEFENNGYTWGYIAGGQRITENFYYPQAGRNFLVRFQISL